MPPDGPPPAIAPKSRRLAPLVVAMQAPAAAACGVEDGDSVSFTTVTPFGECRHVARVRVVTAAVMRGMHGASIPPTATASED